MQIVWNGGGTMLQVSYPDIKEGKKLPVYVSSVGIDYIEEAVSGSRNPTGAAQLLFSAEGAGEVVIDGIAYELPAQSGIYLSDRTVCQVRPLHSRENWKISWVTFGTGIAGCGDMLFLGRDWCTFDLSRHWDYLYQILYGIYDAVTLDAVHGESRASAMLYEMLVLLNGILTGIPRRPVYPNPALEAIIDFIDENYTRDITLEQLCQAAGGLSEQYLCRLFKQNTGMRPMEYMLRRRISAARTYLSRSDMSISEVARLSGFHNTSYFYRNFRKFTGMSPLAYRQAVLGGEGDKI